MEQNKTQGKYIAIKTHVGSEPVKRRTIKQCDEIYKIVALETHESISRKPTKRKNEKRGFRVRFISEAGVQSSFSFLLSADFIETALNNFPKWKYVVVGSELERGRKFDEIFFMDENPKSNKAYHFNDAFRDEPSEGSTWVIKRNPNYGK